MKYVNVVIDNKSNNTDYFYTYRSFFDEIKVGQRVIVGFGKANIRKEAYVFEIVESLDFDEKYIKDVIEIDESTCLTLEAVELCKWMREHYFCRYIDVIKCFVMDDKVSKKTKVKLQQDSSGVLLSNSILEQKAKLTFEQELARDKIFPAIDQGLQKTFLIHGVTSSGKTEIYLQAIAKVVENGKKAIMLVPEISLTTQIISRFEKRFGRENIAVLHSKLTKNARLTEWNKILNDQVKIVIGARSGIFAPIENIGIIIIDEEHEGSYKSDMTPKYDAIEIAKMRSNFNESILILGSATPSISSFYNCEIGNYSLITLKERYNKTLMPIASLIDMRTELKQGNLSIFSKELYRDISENLEKKKQIILFINRRGYSTFITCRSCGYTMKCKDCGVALTYHKENNSAVCHYCGHREKITKICPSCNLKYLKHFGTGTEKVEEVAKELFPAANIERLDLDAVKKLSDIDRVLNDLGKGKIDILIGTQIVAKGLDFSNVGLVGIVAADISLNIPDYRSAERSFQLITQAAGRAGRGDIVGKVVIQTYYPEHYAIKAAVKHDYFGFYQEEINLRNQLKYPPFNQIILLTLSSKKEEMALAAAGSIYNLIKVKAGTDELRNILPPTQSIIYKSKDFFRYQILIKASNEKIDSYRRLLWKIKNHNNENKKSEVLISIDINPYSFY